MPKNYLVNNVIKGLFLISLIIALCGFTAGAGAIALVLFGVFSALSGRTAIAIMAYLIFPFLNIINPVILQVNTITAICFRAGPMLMSFALAFSATKRLGRHNLPISLLWLYLLVAVISSMNGYSPYISYLKLINFSIFLLGISLGLRNIDKKPDAIEAVRLCLLSMSVFLIVGSVVTLAFPSVAYYTNIKRFIPEVGLKATESMLLEMAGVRLFSGVTNQSQCLAVILPCAIAWLTCDMIFVEKTISKFHVVVIMMGIPLVYLTRSRVAFFTSATAIAVIYFYCMGKANVSIRIRHHIRTGMTVGVLGILLIAAVGEVRNQTITRWLRKTEDIAGDNRELSDAIMESRMSKVEQNMHDFRRNPLLGSGFQVAEDMMIFDTGSNWMIFSAPIEKGLLPLMVLGETGVAGGIVFFIFIIVFYTTCKRKRYLCTLAMMTALLATNMAEATFFSPSGVGGILWVYCLGGGFVLDTVVLTRRRSMDMVLL